MIDEVGTTLLKDPMACTPGERGDFARLVRQGFANAGEDLESRINRAQCLAFYRAAGDTLGAIAALKVPGERYRDDVFKRANAPVSSVDYRLELGWVFVAPAHRGNRIAEGLCRQLLARVPTSPLFATTRTANVSMIGILSALGFTRVGKPYPRRDEELTLYLRPSPPFASPTSGG